MMSWTQLLHLDWEWSHPLWALLALQPLLMLLLLRLRRQQVLHYADAHLLPWVLRGGEKVGQERWKQGLNVVAWLLLACAAAGPRLPLALGDDQQAIQRHEMDIMLLLDVSPSMQAQDISPQRLQRAKLKILDLLPRLHGERVGLIVFSGSAGLLMPLSGDYGAVRYYLNLAEPGLFDKPGTAIAAAVDLALRKLPQQNAASRALLLVSDAESSALSGPAGAALWEAADKLQASHIPLYILGVGTPEGATIPQANGYPLVSEGAEVVSMQDQSGFGDLAKKTGGKFVPVADGDSDLRSLYDSDMLTLPGGKPSADRVQSWHELYASFLWPALLLFAFLHLPVRWKKNLPVLLVGLLLTGLLSTGSNDVYAAEADAYAAYHAGNYAQAQRGYGEVAGLSGRMGEGAAAYRRADYQYAIKQFSAALLLAHNNAQRESALFNLANSYFMAGAYRAAAEAYLDVLHYTPDNRDARANLALTAAKLAALRQANNPANGVLGRRGRATGGALDEDASNSPLSMDEPADKDKTRLAHGSELEAAETARLLGGEKQAALGAQNAQEASYQSAAKKQELLGDYPVPLHKALIGIEAAREYVPLPEMAPW